MELHVREAKVDFMWEGTAVRAGSRFWTRVRELYLERRAANRERCETDKVGMSRTDHALSTTG